MSCVFSVRTRAHWKKKDYKSLWNSVPLYQKIFCLSEDTLILKNRNFFLHFHFYIFYLTGIIYMEFTLCLCHLFFIVSLKESKNYEKYFLFNLKSFFRSADIQIIVFLCSSFFPVGHWWIYRKSWLEIIPHVFDVTKCLNWNLKTSSAISWEV